MVIFVLDSSKFFDSYNGEGGSWTLNVYIESPGGAGWATKLLAILHGSKVEFRKYVLSKYWI